MVIYHTSKKFMRCSAKNTRIQFDPLDKFIDFVITTEKSNEKERLIDACSTFLFAFVFVFRICHPFIHHVF